MPEEQFVRGEFKPYRAVTNVHIGAIQDELQRGEVVYYDGQTMKRGPDEAQVSNLRGAIRAGWLVPEDQEGGEYVAKPAGVKIHAAESHGRDRGEAFEVAPVADEERDLGSRADVRARAAAQAKAPGTPAPPVSEAAPTGAMAVDEVEALPDGSEGRVIGKLKNPAEAPKVRIDKDSTRDKAVKREIESSQGPQVIKKAKATGDVQTARSGDELDELLPDAASSGKPKPGVAGEGMSDEELAEKAPWAVRKDATDSAEAARAARLAQLGKAAPQKSEPEVTVSAGSSSVGGEEDGDVVASVRPADEAGTEGEAVTASEPEEPVDPQAIIDAKIEMIRQFVPGFEWDIKVQWRKRVKKALEHKDNMPVLNAILALETDTVRKHVMKQLYADD